MNQVKINFEKVPNFIYDKLNETFKPFVDSKYRNNVLVGGAASGKSYDTAEILIYKILKEEAKREECVISNSNISLYIDDKKIDMVPFVQNILYNSVIGVVKELDGYRKNGRIEIKVHENK